MGASQQKTDTKQTTDTVKKPTSAPMTVAQGVDFSVQNADPEALQRALAKSNGSVRNSAVPAIQRRYGNQVAQRMIAGTVQQRGGSGGGRRMSRVSKSGPSDQPGVIQRDSDDVYGGMEVGPEMESAIKRKQGSGRPLDDETRGSMEGTFGTGFGGVRVHNDAESDALNQSVGARSFTVGQDIFFGEGEYKPGTSDGDRLIAHELTHTIQQTGGAMPPRAKMEVSQADDEYEQEADAVADNVIVSRQTRRDQRPVTRSPGATVQRADDKKEEQEKQEKEKQETEKKSEEAGEKEKQEKKGGPEEKKEEEKKEGAPEKNEAVAEGEGGEAPGGGEGDVAKGTEPLPDEAMERELPPPPDYSDLSWEATKQASLPDWDSEYAESEQWAKVEAGSWDDVIKKDGTRLYALLSSSDRVETVGTGEYEMDRDKMIADALGQGALAGLVEGGIAAVAGAAIGLAAKKIPFLGGFLAIATLAADPKAWFQKTFISDIADPAKNMAKSFAGLADAKSVWEAMALFTEGLLNIVKLAAGIVNLINTIIMIVAAILYTIGSILSSFIFTAPAGAALLSVAGTLNGWAGFLGAIGGWLTFFQFVLTGFATVFRVLDLKYTEADPEQLMAKQAALQSNMKDFVSGGIQLGGAAAMGAATAKKGERWKGAKEGIFPPVGEAWNKIGQVPGKPAAAEEDEVFGLNFDEAAGTLTAGGGAERFQYEAGQYRTSIGAYSSEKIGAGYDPTGALGEAASGGGVWYEGKGGGLGGMAASEAYGGFGIDDPGKLTDEGKKEEYLKKAYERYGTETTTTRNVEEEFKQAAQEKAATLPERPNTEEKIMANTAELAMIADEKIKLQDVIQDAKITQQVGKQQSAAGAGIKNVSAANQQAVQTHKQDLAAKQQSQQEASKQTAETQTKVAEGQGQSQKTSGKLSSGKGMMQGGMKKAEEKGQNTGGADPGKTQDAGPQATNTATQNVAGANLGAQINTMWQAQTTKAQAESDAIVGQLQALDAHVEAQKAAADEGTEEAQAAEEQAQADYEALTAREEALKAQREGIVAEGQGWIDAHRAARQAILAELEASLGKGGGNETEK